MSTIIAGKGPWSPVSFATLCMQTSILICLVNRLILWVVSQYNDSFMRIYLCFFTRGALVVTVQWNGPHLSLRFFHPLNSHLIPFISRWCQWVPQKERFLFMFMTLTSQLLFKVVLWTINLFSSNDFLPLCSTISGKSCALFKASIFTT